jgi:hypothetical protein
LSYDLGDLFSVRSDMYAGRRIARNAPTERRSLRRKFSLRDDGHVDATTGERPDIRRLVV